MYRPPVGIPRREQARWQGWLISLLAHLLLLLLIIVPAVEANIDLGRRLGAGGAEPAGGGGGGSSGGAGDTAPRLRFIQIAPARAPAAPSSIPHVAPVVAPTPLVTPPIPKTLPQPVTPAAVPPKPVQPTQPTQQPPTSATSAAGSAVGTGSGTGHSSGAGAGPGTGGGVGSGEGIGRGTSTGPGTGGGAAQIYPPTPRQFFLPPLPPPPRVKGFRLTAWFDVDSTGKSTLLRFTPTPDGDYNKRLRETLAAVRFRPAVRPDGVPVRDTVDVQFLF
ncbi:MAG: hypothetical protein ACR2MQ_12805 [Gemmatimonadaceae bacterium]